MSDYGATHEEEVDSLNDVIEDLAAERNQLRAEVARLTPTATRELPTREGYYQIQRRAGDPVRVCEVRKMYGVLKHWHSVCDAWLELDDTGPLFWSREPIAPMTIPEGGEG